MIPLKLKFYEPQQTRVTIRPDSCNIKKKQTTLNSVKLHLIFKPSYTKKKSSYAQKNYNELKRL